MGAFICYYCGKLFSVNRGKRLFLYVWHTIFCIFYCWYVLNNGGDAVSYYNWGESTNWEFRVGTQSVEILAGVLISGFGLSFLGVFLVFNIFGTVGLLAFDGALKIASSGKSKAVRLLAALIPFLPSISFWSSALGKDAIAFMATGLALWSAMNLSKRGLLMAFAVTAMLLVRPHIAGIMILALIVSIVFDSRVSPLGKIGLSAVSLAVAAVMLPFALRYSGLRENITIEFVTGYIEKRQSYNMDGGGGVDIAALSLPEQLFTYLFRPIVFEAQSVFDFAAAIDNLILLGLSVVGLYSLFLGRSSGLGENRIFMWAYAFGVWLILATTTANLGIAMRQKWMFVPILVFLLVSLIGRRRQAYYNRG
jgi:hypothetical protein